MLGGGGYVAGPMVLAAARRRIPAALTEADAHLGLANRLAAPFARARLPRVSDRRAASAPKYRGHRPADPGDARPLPRDGGARAASACPRTGRCCSSPARSQGARALNELAVEAFGEAGPASCTSRGERDYDALRARVSRATTTGCVPCTDDFGAALGAADLALARAGGRRSGSSRPRASRRSSSRTRSRPPTTRRRTRATSSARGGAIVVPETRARPRAGARALAARRPGPARGR